MKLLLLALFTLSISSPNAWSTTKVLSFNIFDQLQGDWASDFREKRVQAFSAWVKAEKPEIIVLQEAMGELSGEKKGGKDSYDSRWIRKSYPHRFYVHEMTGKDGASYGYWLGSKKPWKQKIEDGFSFPGGVERKVQGAVWEKGSGKNKKCLGIISLHFSYQNSEVRQKESAWVLDWLKSKEKLCKQWLVLGDFNADENSAEMKLLFEAGLKSLAKELKPTVGAFNPIRQIYGKNIPSKTIDWALGWNVQQATAETVFDKPVQDLWLSDHAGLAIVVNDF